jgi:hypothetical protein
MKLRQQTRPRLESYLKQSFFAPLHHVKNWKSRCVGDYFFISDIYLTIKHIFSPRTWTMKRSPVSRHHPEGSIESIYIFFPTILEWRQKLWHLPGAKCKAACGRRLDKIKCSPRSKISQDLEVSEGNLRLSALTYDQLESILLPRVSIGFLTRSKKRHLEQ